MKNLSLNSSQINENKFEIDSLRNVTEFFSNARIKEKEILPTKTNNLLNLSCLEDNAKQIYNVNNEIYFYAENGKVFVLKNGTLLPFTELHSLGIPKVIKAPTNFGNSILLIDDSNYLIRGETNGALYLPKGDGYFANEDMMFVFSKNKLLFACRDDEDFLLKERYFGRIDINSSLGDILAIGVFDSKLYVVSEYGISTILLSESREDFKVSSTCAIPLAVKKDSIKFLGDKICFICGKKLCIFSGNKIEYLEFVLEKFDYQIVSPAISFLDRYAVKVLIDNKEYLYCYSTLEKCEEIFDAKDLLFTDGGYYFNKVTKDFGCLDSGENSLFIWESKKLDLGKNGAKYLSSICLIGEGEFELEIVGDNCKKKYKIFAQRTVSRIMCVSINFKFVIKSLSPNSKIEKIEITFR